MPTLISTLRLKICLYTLFTWKFFLFERIGSYLFDEYGVFSLFQNQLNSNDKGNLYIYLCSFSIFFFFFNLKI